MAYLYKSPSHMPNFSPFWDEDTNPAPIKESDGNKQPIILWNPEQPDFGPVFHVRVNFQDLPDKVECTGPSTCPHCKATKVYTRYLRENGYELEEE